MADGHGAERREQVKAPNYDRGLAAIAVGVVLLPFTLWWLLELLIRFVPE